MDELGKSFPAAEGMVDAEQSGNLKRHNENCLNCGTKLTDIFCHHCGQKDIPRRQTLGELFSNFISSFWSYEGKFFLTTKYLITKPGFLAVEYNAGRRESYYHPARMYVFISFVFFLFYFSLPEKDEINATTVSKSKMDLTEEDLKELKDDAKEAKLDSIFRSIAGKDSTLNIISPGLADSIKTKAKKKNKWNGINWGLSKAEYKSIQAYDSAQQLKPEKDRDGWIKNRLMSRVIVLNQKYKDDGSRFAKDFGTAFKDNFSKVLFYLLPIFALLLKLLYVRRDFFYSEHLVFSIYYYNFFYLAGCVQMLVSLIPGMDWLGSLIGVWIFFYLMFAMKRMYQQSWRKTILKFFLFVFTFFWFALIGLGISAMTILMMI